MSSRRQAICLYKQLLREAEKLKSYNFRMYAARKIRHTFRTNRTTNDFEKTENQILSAQQSLDLIRRQVVIGHLYSADKLVIEQKKTLLNTDD